MAYKNKTYVAFDADNDIHYYRLMLAWKQSDNTSFNFYNAHDLNNLRDTSNEDTIKDKLRARLKESKFFVLLVGEQTKYLYKFVRWEIEQALKLGIPIIVVNLNGSRKIESEICPAILRDELAIHVSFNAKIVQYALENWEKSHKEHLKNDEVEPFQYKKSVYEELGL